MAVPILVKILVIFGLVVVISRKAHLGLAAFAGGILFGFWSGLPLGKIVRETIGEFLDPETILLFLVVTGIMCFSAAMKKAGALDDFARAVEAVSPGPRASLIITPLLIGTLPMPGGAMLSAPLVDALDPERRQGAERLSAVNYWFRHCIELVWPLFPAFILTSTLAEFSVPKLMALNAYSSPVLIILGSLFLIRRSVGGKKETGSHAPASREGSRLFLAIKGFAPLIVILGSYGIFDWVWRLLDAGRFFPSPMATAFGRYMPILCGLGVGAIYLSVKSHGAAVFRGTLSRSVLKLVGVIAGIRVFSALLQAGGVAEAGAAELAAWGIPPLLVVILLPLVSGLVTGVGFGYVGLSFPIVLGLFPPGGLFPREAAVVLAGAFGFAGMMLSPLHVCMVVTAEHFGTGLLGMIKRFALPLGLFLVTAMVYVFFLSRLLG